jgi:hypothetical protein
MSNLSDALLKQIIKSTFLPKLSTKGKEYCKMGHNLELPYAELLLMHSKEALTYFIVDEIFCVGLVGKENELYAKASFDFMAVTIIENQKHLVGVECKARVTSATQQRERAQSELLSRLQSPASSTSSASTTTTTTSSTCTFSSTGSSRELYAVVDAASNDFHSYVDS